MKFELTERQAEGIRKRFAATVDLKKEFIAARQYMENIHAGRPYKNLGRFFWNWCLRAEAWKTGRGGKQLKNPGARPAKPGELEAFCSECGRLRTAALAPMRGSDTLCGWCGHVENACSVDGGAA